MGGGPLGAQQHAVVGQFGVRQNGTGFNSILTQTHESTSLAPHSIVRCPLGAGKYPDFLRKLTPHSLIHVEVRRGAVVAETKSSFLGLRGQKLQDSFLANLVRKREIQVTLSWFGLGSIFSTGSCGG